MTDTTASPPLPLIVCIGWGAGTLAVASLFNAVNVLLLRYLVDFVGIGAGLAGSMLALSKFYDAIIDPMIGTISDRSRSKAGRRRPFVLAGGFMLVVAALMLFNTPAFSPTGTLVWVVASLLVYATAYATFSVPYMAMPAEMTRDYHERSYLISFRVLAVALASLVAVFVGPVVIGALGGGRQGHTALSFLIAAIVLAGTVFCYFATARAPAHYAVGEARIGFFRKLVLISENKPFILLLCIKLMQLLALAVSQAAAPFLFKRVLHLSDAALGLYFLTFYGIMIAMQPVWVRVARKYGKRDAYMYATIVYALIYASWYLTTPNEAHLWVYVRGALLGITGGAVLLFGQSLLPDTMEWDYRRTGLRREGMLSGLYTVVEKLAYALGAGITGMVLGASGYIQGTGKAAVMQPASAISAIFFLASLAPMIFLLLSCVGLRFYNLSEKSLQGEAAAGA